MTKGRYNISVPGGSNLKKGSNNNNETDLEDQECLDSCLSSSFLRSLSFHDRPRSSRIPPINKELHKSHYKALVSASLENIPSKAFPSSEGRPEYSTRSGFEPIGVCTEVKMTSPSTTNFGASSQTDQNQLSEADNRLGERYTRFGLEAEKLLKQSVAVLRSVDKEISESFADLIKPESIALESVIENYKKKDESIKRCSAVFDFPKELSSEPIYENWHPSVHRTPKDEPVIDNHKKKDKSVTSCSVVSDLSTEPSSEPIYENCQPSYRTPKDSNVYPSPQRLNDMQTQTSRQNAKDLLDQSLQQNPKNIKPRTPKNPKNLMPHSSQHSPKNLQIHSVQLNPKNLLSHAIQQTPKNPQTPIVQESPKNVLYHSVKQSQKNLEVQSQRSSKNLLSHSLHSLENLQAHFQQNPKNLQEHSQDNVRNLEYHFQRNPKNLQGHSQLSPKNLQGHSQLSPTNLQGHSQLSLKNLQGHSQQSPRNSQACSQEALGNLQAHFQQNLKNLHGYSQDSLDNLLFESQQGPENVLVQTQQSPKKLLVHSQQSPKNLLVYSAQQTLKHLESLLISDLGNAQSSDKPVSDDSPSIERSPKNDLSSPVNTTAEKSLIDFDLPSDHQQFVKLVGALQNRCLEYREMIQDVAVLVLEEFLNFSELTISRIRHLRKQFESLKKNFGDFKELCCKSVVFGPDSLSIDEKVTEVIQSFYLKLLQEENETFMARLEFGLKMAEIYARMLKYETESRKVITTLEKEILYLKKTSVGFKV